MTLILSRRCYQIKNLLLKNTPAFFTSNATADTIGHPFMTLESNPEKHGVNDLGLIYTIPNSLSLNVLFKKPILQPYIIEECKTFEETPIIIRKPAIEIINFMRNTDFTKPVNRYLLYGKYGNGKTTTILHLLHYASVTKWLIVHVHSIVEWGYIRTERNESTTMEGFLDTPSLGSTWLMQFKTQNEILLNELDARLHKTYTWNAQEEQKAGDPLLDLINHGITRGRYSCDVIFALFDEIKKLSREGKIKTFVAIDNFSQIFQPAHIPRRKNKIKHLTPSKMTAVQAFKSLVKPDWHNGVVVLSCASSPRTNSTVEYLPLNQLTKEGMEFLNPFIPIEVPYLTKQEIKSFLNYFKSKNWLRSSEGYRELEFLCGGSPKFLKQLCGPL